MEDTVDGEVLVPLEVPDSAGGLAAEVAVRGDGQATLQGGHRRAERPPLQGRRAVRAHHGEIRHARHDRQHGAAAQRGGGAGGPGDVGELHAQGAADRDRTSTRLNSCHTS